MREIKAVVVIVANPCGKDDPGQCAEGWYFMENGTMTMCDRDGVPLRDENTGRQHTIRLQRGDKEKAEAKRFTLRLHRAADRDGMSGFHRPIRYGQSGLA